MSRHVGCNEFITESLHSDKKTLSRDDVHLPEEIIGEILSRSPVKSILRFKCVCKLWLSITLDPEYIHNHMMRTTETIWAGEEGSRHYIRSMSRGLILERALWPTSTCRLRNPTTRRVFYLPDYDQRDLFRLMRLWYVSETRTFKVAFPSPEGSFKILSVGVDETWRTIDFPFTTSKLTQAYNLGIVIEGVYIVVVSPTADENGNNAPETRDGPDVVCLEMGSEKVWKNNIPKDFFESMKMVTVTNWDGKPAIAGRLGYDGPLYILVLKDYKTRKWAEHVIVVDMSSVYGEYYVPYYFKDDEVWMHHYHKTIVVNTTTKVVTRIKKMGRHKFKGQPSLVDFKGMKPCNGWGHENRVIIDGSIRGFTTTSQEVFADTHSTGYSDCAEFWLHCPKRAV